MNSKRKLIFGMIAIVLGILSLLLGMILFIRSTGIDALFYTSVRELRLTFFLGLLFISWGYVHAAFTCQQSYESSCSHQSRNSPFPFLFM